MDSPKRPNQDALYQALNIYRDAMRPFILRNLKTVQGLSPEERFQNEADIDIGDFPHLFRRYWHNAFEQRFDPDRDVRSAVGIVTEARNQVSHPGTEDIDLSYALSRLHDIADVLGQINAPDQKREVEAIRDTLLTRAASTVDPKPKLPRRKTSDLKSWRDVIRPNTDVIEGTFRKSEFAADLQEVFEGNAKTPEYGETEIFFNQTYITPGLRKLLVNTLKRLGGKGGNPVIQLKTGFGGGKTHSLIALYHLVTGINILRELPADGPYARLWKEIEDILAEAEWDTDTPLNTNISVLVGTYLSTTDADETQQGDPLNTLWGMMADQLGGQDGYNLVRKAAREGTAPGGNQLDALFEHVGPSVILIDELVAYVRNVQGVTRESIYTFFQAVTESVKRSENVTLIATLPEGQTHAGGEGGLSVLEALESILERVDAVSIPLEMDNAYEVVRRRLFSSEIDETERDLTCEAFRRMYQNSRNEYPEGVNDQRYLQRMKDCYPIHPEVFDRLSQDWAVIPGFQRTRGVLRMMATCISRLYQEQDPSLLIMPANLTLDDPALADEFTRLLARSGGHWDPIVQEIDSHGSRTEQIDRSSQNFIEIGNAARRTARTIFLGSATGGAVKGITNRQIHLGVVEPGQGVAVYNDALSRMSGNLYFLYNLDDRYYFHTQENLNKVAIDRAAEYTDTDIYAEIVSRLERAIGRDPSVNVCPTSPSSVKDSETIQYVILHPQASLPSREKETDIASDTARHILTYSAEDDRQRTFRNTLLFIAPRRDAIRDLINLVKKYLAWNSIMNGDVLNSALTTLEGARLDQTTENLESAEDAVTTAIFKAYRWTLAPTQADPQKNTYDFSIADAKVDDRRIISRLRDKFVEDDAIITKIAPEIFSTQLQQYIWSSDTYQEHIGLDTLWELMAQNVYMPRLRDRSVLATCIREGIAAGVFGYASAYEGNDYRNFRFEEQIGGLRVAEGSTAVLINPEMAKLIKEEKEKEHKPDPSESASTTKKQATDDSTDIVVEPPPAQGPTHVVVTKALQLELPFMDEIETLQDEIARTLQADGGNVKIEITVTANKSDGFSENTTRAVKQNSEHLNAEFESN
ncbi:MAG: DUF499 domain-containing protein [Candidatus Poribacteria bacterium]|nr:DUF499 domain-containing protein [Candidatus Poribacteria bacterium]